MENEGIPGIVGLRRIEPRGEHGGEGLDLIVPPGGLLLRGHDPLDRAQRRTLAQVAQDIAARWVRGNRAQTWQPGARTGYGQEA